MGTSIDSQTNSNILMNAVEFRKKAEQILYNALQPDQNVRKIAEEQISVVIAAEYPLFICVFGDIMLDLTVMPGIRNLASIVLKNTFHSKSKNLKLSYQEKWIACPEVPKEAFRNLLQANLNSKNKSVLNSICTLLGSIARIEIIHEVNRNIKNNPNSKDQEGISNSFFIDMYKGIGNMEYAVGILNAVAAATGQLYDETNYSFKNTDIIIYKISTYYLNNPCCSIEVLTAALDCTAVSLEIFSQIFKQSEEQMSFTWSLLKLSEETQDYNIKKLVLNVVNIFVETCIEYIDPVLPEVVKFYNGMVAQPNPTCIMQICEFWSILTDTEDSRTERFSSMVFQNYPIFLPLLLHSLTNEEVFVTEWTDHKACSALLVSLTAQFGDVILNNEITQHFIITKLNSQDSNQRSIGAIALGSTCSKNCSDFLCKSLSVLIRDFTQESVSNELLYAIARVCEVDLDVTMSNENLSSFSNFGGHKDNAFLSRIIKTCGELISNDSDFTENAVWIFHAIFSSAKCSIETHQVVRYHFNDIIFVLVSKMNNIDSSDFSIRNALNTTLTEAMKHCDDLELLGKLISHFYTKMHEVLTKIYSVDFEEMLILEDVLSGFIALQSEVLYSIKRNITFGVNSSEKQQKSGFDSISMENAFSAFLELPSNTIKGEVFIAVSKLIDECSELFLEKMLNSVLEALQKKDRFLMHSALNLLCDIATKMDRGFGDHLIKVVPALVDTITNTSTSLSFKANVMESFGTIALVCGNRFSTYVEMAVVLFSKINNLDRSSDDEKHIDRLYVSILKLMSCIVVGCGDSIEMRNHLPQIANELYTAMSKSQGCDKEIIELLIDLTRTYKFKELRGNWVKEYLSKIMTDGDYSLKTEASKVYNYL